MIDFNTQIQLIADYYNISLDIYNMGFGQDEYVLRYKNNSLHITHNYKSSNSFFNIKIIKPSITNEITSTSTEKLFTMITYFCEEFGYKG